MNRKRMFVNRTVGGFIPVKNNPDHLLEKGCAIKCNTLSTLAYKIYILLEDKEREKTMRKNIRNLATPRGAETIVKAC